MLYARPLSYAVCVFAIAANAQLTSDSTESSSSSSTSSGDGDGDVYILTGGKSEPATPTGRYTSYTSTVTIPTTTSAITTSAILSTVTKETTTFTTTLGSTTIYDHSTGEVTTNATVVSETSSSSQVFLSGVSRSTHSSTSNSTSSATSSNGPLPTCNNYPELCERKYGNITEVSTHNSPFIKPNNAAANQALDVTAQLNDGVRMLQGQIHFNGTIPHFCHTSCNVLDAGPITDFLGAVYDWVSVHPFDIVTILLGNGGYEPVEKYVPFLEQTGLVRFAYTPPKIPMGVDDWPDLSQLILTGKRVLFFMDYEANQTAVPWIMDEFSQIWETPFDPTDRSFPCVVQRPPDLAPEDAKARMYLLNHNLNYEISLLGNSLLVPNIPLLNITNNITGDGSLGEGTAACNDTWGHPPKFLNVDYYDVGKGSVFAVAAKFNNVTYDRPCCGLPPSASTALNAPGRGVMLSTAAVLFSLMILW